LSLRMICSAVCLVRFMVESPAQSGRMRALIHPGPIPGVHVTATGFFEKNYFVSRLDQRSFWIAGLWDRWLGSDGSELDTCTILTTAPNALIQPLHDRMPVLIPDGLEEAWLAVADGHDLRALEPLLMGWDPQGWKVGPIQRWRNEPSSSSIQGSLFEIN